MPDTAATTASPNVDHRSQNIRDALESMYQLDKEIDDLIERHIAPLRQEKRDIKKRMREEYDVPTKRFNGRYMQYREERRAIDNRDENALDAIRYLYNLAPVGQQVDWIDGLAAADADGEEFLNEPADKDATGTADG